MNTKTTATSRSKAGSLDHALISISDYYRCCVVISTLCTYSYKARYVAATLDRWRDKDLPQTWGRSLSLLRVWASHDPQMVVGSERVSELLNSFCSFYDLSSVLREKYQKSDEHHFYEYAIQLHRHVDFQTMMITKVIFACLD